jgi:hypothetical protein
MELINQTIVTSIDNKCEFVNQCFPSLFSKEDVIKLLNQLREEITNELSEIPFPSLQNETDNIYTEKQIKEAFDNLCIKDAIDVDYDSAELELDHRNQISVTDIDFEIDESELCDALITELNRL